MSDANGEENHDATGIPEVRSLSEQKRSKRAAYYSPLQIQEGIRCLRGLEGGNVVSARARAKLLAIVDEVNRIADSDEAGGVQVIPMNPVSQVSWLADALNNTAEQIGRILQKEVLKQRAAEFSKIARLAQADLLAANASIVSASAASALAEAELPCATTTSPPNSAGTPPPASVEATTSPPLRNRRDLSSLGSGFKDPLLNADSDVDEERSRLAQMQQMLDSIADWQAFLINTTWEENEELYQLHPIFSQMLALLGKVTEKWKTHFELHSVATMRLRERLRDIDLLARLTDLKDNMLAVHSADTEWLKQISLLEGDAGIDFKGSAMAEEDLEAEEWMHYQMHIIIMNLQEWAEHIPTLLEKVLEKVDSLARLKHIPSELMVWRGWVLQWCDYQSKHWQQQKLYTMQERLINMLYRVSLARHHPDILETRFAAWRDDLL